ncbi:MAG TPA: enolase C-terminal domain-like protein, partial [Caldilineaceae bacterium]|nr:enolase C-terminal domain-like protein [Caldilineaceae bacterium]
MHISRVDAYEVVVPIYADAVNSPAWGPAIFDTVPKVIVRLTTDGGQVGWGESQRGASRDEVTRGAQNLLGLDPLTINLQDVATVINDFAWPANRALHAFDTALHDLVGKLYAVPAHVLLGGAYRRRVPVAYWTGRRTPEDIERIARHAREQGFTNFKFKLARAPGQNALDDPIVERMAATVRAAPDMQVTIDPNEMLGTPHQARQVMARLADYAGNLQVLESPVPQYNLDWYALLRQHSPFAIGLHLNSRAQVINAIKHEAADVLNLGGTMAEFVSMSRLAAAAGMAIWHGSGVDLGLLDASYVHAAACAETCTLGSDIVGHFVRQHTLLRTALRYSDGHVELPDGPGLGVEIDLKALHRY